MRAGDFLLIFRAPPCCTWFVPTWWGARRRLQVKQVDAKPLLRFGQSNYISVHVHTKQQR